MSWWLVTFYNLLTPHSIQVSTPFRVLPFRLFLFYLSAFSYSSPSLLLELRTTNMERQTQHTLSHNLSFFFSLFSHSAIFTIRPNLQLLWLWDFVYGNFKWTDGTQERKGKQNNYLYINVLMHLCAENCHENTNGNALLKADNNHRLTRFLCVFY